MSTSPQTMQALMRLGQSGSQMAGSSGMGQGFGDASLGMGIYGGLSSGSPMGYANAAIDAGKLTNSIGGQGTIPGVGAAGDALGIYSGLTQGGVGGYGRAALDAFNLYNTVGNLAGAGAAGAAGAGTAAADAAGAGAGAAAGEAAGTLAGTVGQYVPVVGMLLSAYLNSQMPTVTLKPDYYKRMSQNLASGPGPAADSSHNASQEDLQQEGNFWGALGEASASDDPVQLNMLKAYGIKPETSQIPSGMTYAQLNQMIGQPLGGAGGNRNAMKQATGGQVKTHFDDGGDVGGDNLDYYTPTDNNGDPYSWQNPTLTDFGSPSNDPYSSLGQAGLLNQNIVNQQNDPYAYNSATSGPISGSPGGLAGLLSNPGLLGALISGGLGLAGSLGSKNGQQTMLANYNPTPPQMFQGSGPSSSNMYGNFSSQPRQRQNPTNINYATAGQNPTPGGNMFYSPSGGGPTAPPSQQSPLQQYGAQLPQQQSSMQPNQLTAQQLISLLTGGQSPASNPGFRLPVAARGGSIHGDGGPIGPLSQHMTPASKGGPSYIQGPGDGTSDDIDARLSNGEYVIDAGSVAMLGNGSNEAGAKKLDELRANLRRHAGKQMVQGKQFMKAKKPQSYIGGQS